MSDISLSSAQLAAVQKQGAVVYYSDGSLSVEKEPGWYFKLPYKTIRGPHESEQQCWFQAAIVTGVVHPGNTLYAAKVVSNVIQSGSHRATGKPASVIRELIQEVREINGKFQVFRMWYEIWKVEHSIFKRFLLIQDPHERMSKKFRTAVSIANVYQRSY